MKIVSETALRVATLSGAVVLFEAGVPRDVSDSIGHVALTLGAKEYKKKEAGKVISEEVSVEEVVQDPTQEPSTLLVTVLEKMIDEGDPTNFKADGYPKASAVNKVMGETVGTDQREAAWESILNS